uniref:Hexosyltransferase n=1 Tax=Acrobeloides nanus TaxID=290746 RepID=A0A914C359_9BILA
MIHLFIILALLINGLCSSENPGPFLPTDYNGPFSLTVKKTPSSYKGCDSATKFIVGIISHPSEFYFRNFIRNNWGAPAYRTCRTTKLIFLMGNSDDFKIDKQVEQEANRYSDILLLDYHETYNLVARKVFGFFRYVNQNCPNVKCVLKGDSDTVINLSGMEKLCEIMPNENHTITGYYGYDIPHRDVESKWYTPYFVYPFNKWPSLVSGFSYLLSGYGIVPRLLNTLRTKTAFFTSENTRRLWEDIFFTGIVRNLAGIPLVHNTGFHWGNNVDYWWHDGKRIILSLETRTSCTKLCTIEYAWNLVKANRRENNFPISRECNLRSLREAPTFRNFTGSSIRKATGRKRRPNWTRHVA